MSGRSRSSRTDGERTREKILEVALPLFAEHGYAGTSIRKVADAAEVNVASLAYHFGDKDGLYTTVVQRLHEDLAAAWPHELPVGTPKEQVAVLIGHVWVFCRAHRQHIRILMRNVLDQGSLPQVVIDRWSDPLLQQGVHLVGWFRPEWPPLQRRLLLLTLMHVIARLVIEDPDQLSAMLGRPEDTDGAVRQWLVDLSLRELGLG